MKLQPITETLKLNYMPYAMSVIVSRAIPQIDGFKPSHRKLLYTMYKMGLLTGAKVKSADVVGQTMKLNPHGDAAIYETLVRLTRGNEALLHPFIDSKGNFGKQYSKDMSYAASRYTEVKLDSICCELFENIEKDESIFIDNYNGTTKEPMLFPTTFPNILVTPNYGIAVGMASSICSFNLKEVCEATIAYIKNRNCDLTQYLLAPDFSTGGQLIYKKSEMETIYNTGKGSFKIRSKYTFDKNNNCIEVTQIPYTTTVEAIIDKIAALAKSGKIREINDIRDETDLNGLKIAIDIKKGTNHEVLMHRLFALTTLSDSSSVNFNVLIEGKPKTLSIYEILEEWIKFRIDCIKRQTVYDINKISEKLHILYGLSKIISNIDKTIEIIRETEQDKLVVKNIMENFKSLEIDEIQAEFISEIKLRNLNKQYIASKISEIESLENQLSNLNLLVKDNANIEKLICKQLKEVVKKYGKARKTEIIYDDASINVSQQKLIDDYNIKLFLTAHNYFKKIPMTSLRQATEQNLKDDDFIVSEIETTNKADVLFFSNKQNVYKAKAYELLDCKASLRGEYLTNLLTLSEDEQIICIAATTDYSENMFFAFENGKAAKIAINAYATKVNRKKLINAYSDKSPLVFAECIKSDKDYIFISNLNKAMLFNTKVITQNTTKGSSGIQILKLRKSGSLNKVLSKENFVNEKEKDVEYYRALKIPSIGKVL